MSERTTARGKSGTACEHCGTAYDTCTEQVFQRYQACCGSCRRTSTHDERDEPVAEAVWCEAHNPVGAPLTAATAHARTDECVHPHGSGARVPAGPRTWEIPAEPTGVGTVHTHDRDTGEPVVWYRTADGTSWSLRPGGRPGDVLYTWAELMAHGPVVEGRPAPRYRLGFYRLRGSLIWSTPDGTALKASAIQPGVLVAVTAMTARDDVPTLRVMLADGEHGLALTRKFHEAGPERVKNP